MSEPNKLWAPRFFFWLGILIAGGLLLFLLPRHHYYFLSPAQRPIQPEHDVLRSSGYGGLTFGAIGTCLIFLNLSYLIRKELVHVSWLGNLRSWMSFHVATGLVAGLLVLLHSGFLLRSALGSLALIAFAVVIITGVVGRYIYAHTPRSLEGSELEMDEVRKRLKEYRSSLEKLGMPQEVFNTLLKPPTISSTEIKGILGSLMGMITGDRQLRHTYDELQRIIQKSPALRPLGREITPLALRYCKELQWLSRYHELRGLMSGWRFFHRWLAILMLSAVLFHVMVAAQMGNLWLFDAHRLHQAVRFYLQHVPSLHSVLARFR